MFLKTAEKEDYSQQSNLLNDRWALSFLGHSESHIKKPRRNRVASHSPRITLQQMD
jgi:hypothetical protein